MHLVHGADLYFPQDYTDTGSPSLLREAIIREFDLEKLMVISVLSPVFCIILPGRVRT